MAPCMIGTSHLCAPQLMSPPAITTCLLQDQVHHVREAGIEAASFSAGQDFAQARELMDR